MWKVIPTVIVCLFPGGFAFAQSGTSTPQSPTDSGMAQPADIQNKPKTYQPVNPAPDARTAPTSSSAGTGPDSGGRPEAQPKK